MIIKANNIHQIKLKQYLVEEDFKEVNGLKEVCDLEDRTNLKLELEYKRNMVKDTETTNNINEFLYYIGDKLVSYLGISSFGGNKDEINGMTHPMWRRNGIFTKLLNHAIIECQTRQKKLLLLSDGNSNSGISFIKSVGGSYAFSEYRMKMKDKVCIHEDSSIELREANNADQLIIRKLDQILFDGIDAESEEIFIYGSNNPNEFTYMIENSGKIIGKIRVEYSDNVAFIYGFGLFPNYRGKGYGKAALGNTLCKIYKNGIVNVELDVECKNATALNLYKSLGFKEESVMNYYER